MVSEHQLKIADIVVIYKVELFNINIITLIFNYI